jgi:hypothetical protein
MVDRTTGTAGIGTRHPVQTAAAVVGAVFLLVGALGFVPGVTTSYDRMGFAGHGSGALLLGLFQVSVLHNLAHLAFGVTGVVMARSLAGARKYLVRGGVVYAVLGVYGLLVGHDSPANFVPLNTADNWLHLVLAVGMTGLGVLLARADG